MLTLIQRVKQASVSVDEKVTGQINQGLLILCGFEKGDDLDTAKKLIDKCLNYRVFEDDSGKMNLSTRDIDGGILFVPQFTLAANTNTGLRPSFSCALAPKQARLLFYAASSHLATIYPGANCGQFGADMQVSLINDGPVTFLLKS